MADNITHALAAALLAQVGLRQRYGAVATVALVLGSELPDIDALFGIAGPITAFVNHRGITHSFVGGAGLALVAAGFLWLVWQRRAYWRLAGLVYGGILLHMWMDYLTSYGTQLLLPFDAGHYTADAVFIVDYCYTAIMLLGLLAVRMLNQQWQGRYRALGLLWVLVGAGLWWAADPMTPTVESVRAQQTIGLWMLGGALGLRAILWGLQQRRPHWPLPPGSVGLTWVLFGLGAWLSIPRFVPLPLVLVARQDASLYMIGGGALLSLLAWLGRGWTPARAVVMGRVAVATLAIYVGLCYGHKALAEQHMAQALGLQMAQVQRMTALPMPGGGLWRWRVIAETETSYLSGLVSLYSSVTSQQHIAKGLETDVVQATRQYHLVQVFWDFARFPIVEVREQATETLVRYTDLRFSGDGRGRSWFDLTVRVNRAGEVQGIHFLNRQFLLSHPEFAGPTSRP